ncbi:MAG: SUF system NifU family Fe-S cluster assembly protein [Gemmatimonadota bacterium]
MTEPRNPPYGAPIDRSIPDALSGLFQEVILDHYRRPRNKGALEDPTHTITMNNPFCGDVIELSLTVRGDVIEKARFQGKGCSISLASVSMMARKLEGTKVADAQALSVKFTRLLHGERELEGDKELGDLRALSGVSKFPVRIKCALLGFNCLQELIGESGSSGDRAAGHEPGSTR